MITSRQNPKIQQVRALLGRPRERKQTGSFVVEGVRLAEEALAAGWKPQIVLYADTLSQRGMEVVEKLRGYAAETEMVSAAVLASVSETEASQGILAVYPIRAVASPPRPDFVVIADAIHDPGNLGTLLRAAAAAGVQTVIAAPGTADAYAPKVVRAAMGAHFRLPVVPLDWEAIARFTRENRLRVYLADASGAQACWDANLREPVALVIGSEAEGVTPPARSLADGALQIPMPGRSESLNAAVAGAILMFEVVRQRRGPAG